MGINKTYAVFGLGRYGLAVAKELVYSGAEVLAVDANENVVNSIVATLPYAKCADVTDAEVIKNLGIGNIDVVIVAMASSLEVSVMAVSLCKEAGVKTVIAKCANELHGKILSKVGADKVVLPESESGTRLAKTLLSAGFIDVFDLSSEVSIIEVDVKDEWVSKTLAELDLRKNFGFNVIAIKSGENVQAEIDPNAPLASGQKLEVVVNVNKLKKLKSL